MKTKIIDNQFPCHFTTDMNVSKSEKYQFVSMLPWADIKLFTC